MINIGLIDDREQQRVTLAGLLETTLMDMEIDNFKVIDSFPLDRMEGYISWIKENDIVVLLLDERLCEGSGVDYRGSDLVIFLREVFKDFPIYAITSYSDDEDLKKKFADFDDVIPRDIFVKQPEVFVPRFVRAGKVFLKLQGEHLDRLAMLSKKAAMLEATDEEIKEIERLQTALQIPFTPLISSKEEWLACYQEKVNELEQLSEKIADFIKKRSE